MEIRRAEEHDLPAIVSIYNATIPGRQSTADLEPVSVSSLSPWFRRHSARRPIWVAEADGQVAAWLSFQDFYGRPAYQATAELSVYVEPSRRRQGIGETLLSKAIAEAPPLGLTTLLGFIFGHNEPSLALFESHGFTRWGILPAVAKLDGVERDLVIVGRRVD